MNSASLNPVGHIAEKKENRAITTEWLSQTIASICWTSSVFVYGLSSAGDWLQLAAATSWLFANLISLHKS